MVYLLFQIDFIGPGEPLEEGRIRDVLGGRLSGRRRTLPVGFEIFAAGARLCKDFKQIYLMEKQVFF